jgi:hypothetical protein
VTRAATAAIAFAALPIGLPAAAEPTEPIVDRRWGFQLKVPEGWSVRPLEGAPPEVLLLYRHEAADQLLMVSRLAGPAEEAELSVVEQSLKTKGNGYERLEAKRRALGEGRRVKIPAWDLWFRVRRDGKPVAMGARFLFYRSYVLSLLVDAPGQTRPTRALRRIVESFVPPPPEPRAR